MEYDSSSKHHIKLFRIFMTNLLLILENNFCILYDEVKDYFIALCCDSELGTCVCISERVCVCVGLSVFASPCDELSASEINCSLVDVRTLTTSHCPRDGIEIEIEKTRTRLRKRDR